MENWKEKWTRTAQLIKAHGGQVLHFDVAPPASLTEVEAVERRLRLVLPSAFRAVLLEFSAAVRFEYVVESNLPFGSGCLWWDLSLLPELQKRRRGWARASSFDPNLAYSWRKSLAFASIMNGDMVGIDMSPSQKMQGKVIYLDHELGENSHDYVLGNDFIDYVNRLTHLHCVGMESWYLAPFLIDPYSGLQTESPQARELTNLLEKKQA